MKTYPVTLPELAIVAATRGIAGVGIGLLASGFCGRIPGERWAGRC